MSTATNTWHIAIIPKTFWTYRKTVGMVQAKLTFDLPVGLLFPSSLSLLAYLSHQTEHQLTQKSLVTNQTKGSAATPPHTNVFTSTWVYFFGTDCLLVKRCEEEGYEVCKQRRTSGRLSRRETDHTTSPPQRPTDQCWGGTEAEVLCSTNQERNTSGMEEKKGSRRKATRMNGRTHLSYPVLLLLSGACTRARAPSRGPGRGPARGGGRVRGCAHGSSPRGGLDCGTCAGGSSPESGCGRVPGSAHVWHCQKKKMCGHCEWKLRRLVFPLVRHHISTVHYPHNE